MTRPEPVAEHPSGFPHGQSAGKSPRPEPVATADLVAQARGFVGAFRATGLPDSADLMEQIAKALEDTAAERDRAHATLREIEACDGNTCFGCKAKAGERLANP